MRCTQYIGLTYAALEFVKDMNCFPQKDNNYGMFDENVPMSIWYAGNGRIYVEIFQVAPWSSGPMIFTCLENFETRERLFEWIEGTPEDREYNPETGRYYV